MIYRPSITLLLTLLIAISWFIASTNLQVKWNQAASEGKVPALNFFYLGFFFLALRQLYFDTQG